MSLGRDRLVGKWGIVDVADAVQSVLKLSESGLIDVKRAVITGGSAGGYTVLASLACPPPGVKNDVFAAGTSSFGVSDLRKLAEFTHKFESRYLEKLLGGTPEEIPEVYKERSPVFNADRIVSPLLVRLFEFYCTCWYLVNNRSSKAPLMRLYRPSKRKIS